MCILCGCCHLLGSYLLRKEVVSPIFSNFDPPLSLLPSSLKGGSLNQFLESSSPKLNYLQKINFGIEIATGMAYLHSFGLIHRDLKPENIVIHASGRAAVCDFGVCRQVCEREREGGREGRNSICHLRILFFSPFFIIIKKLDQPNNVFISWFRILHCS